MRTWLRNWLMGGTAPEAVTTAPASRPALKVSHEAEALSRVPERTLDEWRSILEPAAPTPGTVPPDFRPQPVTVAMDDIGGLNAWGSGAFYDTGISFLGYPYLAELSQRPEYRRAAEVVAKEMTRKWIEFTTTGDKDKADRIAKLEEGFKAFKVQKLFQKAAELDGYFGRCHLFIDVGNRDAQGELETILVRRKSKISVGSLKGLRIVEPLWTYPATYNSSDPLSPAYYKPDAWFVMARKVHVSRLLTFVGREVPDLLKPSYMFGGLSLTQMAMDYVNNWLRTQRSVGDTIHSFSKSILATNMDSVLSGGSADSLFKRAALFNNARDNKGLMLLDKETEEFIDVSTPLGTLDHLQAQAQEQVCSVNGIPLVIYTGITPSGLNATSEGELTVWHDWVAAQQEHLFRDNLEYILDVMQLHLFGEVDPDIGFKFVPLGETDEALEANVRKTQADTDQVYIDAGVISPEEVRARIAKDGDSVYRGLDLSVMPEPPDDGIELDDNGDPAMDGDDQPRDEDGKFSVERMNSNTGEFEKHHFQRGDYVRASFGGSKPHFGKITGVSHAKKTFNIGSVSYPHGSAYHAEEPKAPPRKTEKLSKTIERSNAKHGEGLTDADRVPENY